MARQQIRNWAKHCKDMAKQQQRAEAEGQARPEPGLTPPLTYDEHFAARVAQIEATEGGS